MAKLNSYGILTSGEIGDAERSGQLSIAEKLSCPFCEGDIHTKTGDQAIEQPFCETCGVFLPLFWRYIRVAYRFGGFQGLKILQTATEKKSDNPQATTYTCQSNAAGQSLTKSSHISIRSPSQKRQNSGRQRNPHHKGFHSLSRNSSTRGR